ncbi:MAG: helix-turn-helix domain-containing protein [Muribaculaceae bacterium]|nr:helix-turn-helix domain-containing protein [Muribaculaceae bacterium]MCM1480824.1 helix-turn-helix domain-containing protein [Muribaculaceae bacterium]
MFWNVYSELCLSHKTSPSAVAEKIGLSNSITSKWKKGALPKGEILLKLSSYFDCSIDYLIGLDNVPNRKKQPPKLSEDKQRLLYMYDLLTDREQGEILGELKTLTRDRAETKNAETA